MIGSRAVASVAGSAVLVAALLGSDTYPSGTGLASMVGQRAAEALDAIDALEGAVDSAGRATRQAAALVVDGDAPPGPRLGEAAGTLEAALDEAADADRAVRSLNAARARADPAARPFAGPPAPERLAAIAADLRAAQPGADAFAAMRRRTADLLESLERALASAESGRFDAGRQGLATAREHHDALSGWDVGSDALPVWLRTTDAMIRAMETLIEAREAGDAAATSAAEAELAAIADEAATADRALRIAVSEGGAPVVGAETQRLADVTAALHELRDAIGSEVGP